ncbi:MAG TPA: hypothetical protein VMU37_05560 [Caulobacteraceae bacterium]|nr:hypothetical protein [Caulobacteraceae bacterium]
MSRQVLWFAVRNILLTAVLAVVVIALLRVGALLVDAHNDGKLALAVLCYLGIPVVVVVYAWRVATDSIRLRKRMRTQPSGDGYEEQLPPQRLDHRR